MPNQTMTPLNNPNTVVPSPVFTIDFHNDTGMDTESAIVCA